MKVVAEIFSQGEEVVSGQTVDSNAAWLSQQLLELGFSVKRHTAVGDDLHDLVALLREIAERADCCICTGGLGPTVDDLTAEAVSLAAGLPLQFDAEALRQIEGYFAKRQRAMPPANRKQAFLPKGAVRIDNPVGTAPGFALLIRRCWFVFLPGVPSEMKTLFAGLRASLSERFNLQRDWLVTLRSVGIGESAIQQRLEPIRLPPGVQLGFRAATEEVQTKLLFPFDFPDSAKNDCIRQCAEAIGDFVFAIDGLPGKPGGDLLAVVDRLMPDRSRLTVLETASGGLLAAKCQGYEWLETVILARDAAQACQQLAIHNAGATVADLGPQLANQLSGQGSDLVLIQLYQGSREHYQSRDHTISLYNCLLTPTGIQLRSHSIGGSAQNKQTQAAILSLDLLRRYLQDTCH